jgi:1,2-phenylacetyl-CoA epoxidase PaaB subunit
MIFLGAPSHLRGRKPEPPQQPISWDIYRAAAKAKHIGTVEAPDEREAIEKAAKEFKQPATKLMAVRRR